MATLIVPTLYDHLTIQNKDLPAIPVVVMSQSYILNGHTTREKYINKPLSWWDSPLNTHNGMVFIELQTQAQYSFGYWVNPLMKRDDLLLAVPSIEVPDDLAYAANVKIHVFDNENKTINISRFSFWIALNEAHEAIDWMAVNQASQDNQRPSNVDEQYLREHTILEIVGSGGAIVTSVLYYLTHPAWMFRMVTQNNGLSTFIELKPKGKANHAPTS